MFHTLYTITENDKIAVLGILPCTLLCNVSYMLFLRRHALCVGNLSK